MFHYRSNSSGKPGQLKPNLRGGRPRGLPPGPDRPRAVPPEGVSAEAEELREAKSRKGLLPDVEAVGALLGEHELPLVVAQRDKQPVIVEVEELSTGARPFPHQVVELVVPIEMNLEALGSRLVSLEEAVLDVRYAGGRQQRVLKALTFASSGFALTTAGTRSRQYMTCEYIGCSIHSVPSWSNVAMRASGGTNVGLD
jgi:hypothetical protein